MRSYDRARLLLHLTTDVHFRNSTYSTGTTASSWMAVAPAAFRKAEAYSPKASQRHLALIREAHPATRAVLEDYVNAGESLWLNNYLRGLRMDELSDADKQKLREKTQQLDALIRAAPPSKKSHVLFRAIGSNVPALEAYAHGADADFLSKGIVSMSVSFDAARAFLEDNETCCMLVLLLPKGTRMLEVLETSAWAEEGEVLLPHGSKFKVMRTAEVEGVTTYYCKLVS